jgi:hypothetical protein
LFIEIINQVYPTSCKILKNKEKKIIKKDKKELMEENKNE